MPQLPFDYLDKACLAATSSAHGCSNAPTWELEIEGQLTVAELKVALGWLCQAYPTCGATVVPLDGNPLTAKHFAWQWQDRPPLANMVEFHDLREAPDDALAELRDAVHDRFVDLFTTPPLLLVLAWLPGLRAQLFVKQHHALADGHAMVDMLPDFAELLNHARHGSAPQTLSVIPRRAELDAFAETQWLRRWRLLGGVWEYVKSAWKSLFHPLTELKQNLSLDYSGGNRTLHVDVPEAQILEWKSAAKAQGGNLNAMLCAGFLVANRRWNELQGVQVQRMNATTAIDFRPRDQPFRSFANHLGFHIPDLNHAQLRSIDTAMPEILAQVRAQNARLAHRRRYFLERAVALSLKMQDFRKLLFSSPRTVVNLNFSNLQALPLPLLHGEGWQVTAVRVNTPLIPRTAIVLTVTNYAGDTTLNFNFKASVVQRQDVEALCGMFLEEVTRFVDSAARK